MQTIRALLCWQKIWQSTQQEALKVKCNAGKSGDWKEIVNLSFMNVWKHIHVNGQEIGEASQANEPHDCTRMRIIHWIHRHEYNHHAP
jgi:hypothetical protein